MDKFTSRDPNQIVQAEHDENLNASRVTIVGGDFGIREAIQASFKDLKIEMPKSTNNMESFNYKQPMIIEKEVLVKDYEVISIPKIVYETKIVEVEKQVIVKETEIKIVEVPKIVTEYQTIEKTVVIEKSNNKILILFFIGQLLILALSKLIP